MIEPLESRIAPATLVNPTTLTFHDQDGDDVTLKFSKPVLTSIATANAVLKFNTGTVDADARNDTVQQLQLIDLTALPAGAATGLGFTLVGKASKTRGGDGSVNVGFIKATGIDLGTISVGGDLGRIMAGVADATDKPAVKSLTVKSIGEFGVSTQSPGGSLVSTFNGSLPSLMVKGNLRDAKILTNGSAAFAKIGSVTIGGSILGGNIDAHGSIASVNIAGSLIGGSTFNTGMIRTDGALGKVMIGGSVIGTTGNTGVISAEGVITSVKIAGDLRGGGLASSGLINCKASILNAVIGGSIIGDFTISGLILADLKIGRVSVAGDVVGGAFGNSGAIRADGGSIDSVTIKGSLIGGAGAAGAVVSAAGAIGALKIGGSVRAGSGAESGSITAGGNSGAFTIGGSLVGYQGAEGTLGENGAHVQAPSIASVKIGGSIIGGAGASSGKVSGTGRGLGLVSVGGSVLGGAGEDTGAISGGAIGKVTIGGDVRGGAGSNSASIRASVASIQSIVIGGSVFSGAGSGSALIGAAGDLPSVTIKGSLIGTAAQSAVVAAQGHFGGTPSPAIGKLSIGGRVESAEILAGYNGTVARNGDAQIGSVTVGGDWVASSIAAGVLRGADGFFGTADDTQITGINSATLHSRIGSVTIKGQALGTIGGADHFGFVAESIGSVKVGAFSKTLTAGVDAERLGATDDFIAREDVVGADVLPPAFANNPNINVLPNRMVATFTDVDGDLVTVKTSKPVLTADRFFGIASGAGVQIQLIDFSGVTAAGFDLTITAKPQDVNGDGKADGDGFVNIGAINAGGIDLGAVSIAGDLGRILAGDSDLRSPGLKSLTVQSLGEFGASTQAAGGDLVSALTSLGTLTVKGSVRGATVIVNGADDAPTSKLGAVSIGGSVFGGATAGAGRIFALGTIGSVKIGGSVIGGAGDGSGMIDSASRISAGQIAGSLIGGSAPQSGKVLAAGIGSVKIGHNLFDGGSGDSGAIVSSKLVGNVSVGGSVIGNAVAHAAGSGQIVSGQGIDSITIKGDLHGGASQSSGAINVIGKLGSATIGGSVIGGAAQSSGAISAGTLSSLKIAGDVLGGRGVASASIFTTGSLGTVAVGGSVFGGSGANSALIEGTRAFTAILIGRNVIGGSGDGSAGIASLANLGPVAIGGSVLGGAGSSSAKISSGGALGAVKIGHDLQGGAGLLSGGLDARFTINSIAVGGSVKSGTGQFSGSIRTDAALLSLSVKGSVMGTTAVPLLISALKSATPTAKTNLAIGKITIGGSVESALIRAGYNRVENAFNADAQIGTVNIKGNWIASSLVAGVADVAGNGFGNADDAKLTGTDTAGITSKIASIVIKGYARGTVGGTDHFGFVAQEVKALTVGSAKFPLTKNLIAGVNTPSDDRLVGTTGDLRVREVAL
jgi:hypothetical protein